MSGLLIFFWSCRKTEKLDCASVQQSPVIIETLESVGDTLLNTDTAFTNRRIYFQTKGSYRNINWTVGADPRNFNAILFSLVFLNSEMLSVSLSANEDTRCGNYNRSGTKILTIVPGDGSIVSPLKGKYKGFIVGKESDLFDVEIKFWRSPKYTWASEGFYSIHNLPRGFKDTTREINGVPCPELDGVECYPGYHNMAYNTFNNVRTMGLKGVASIRRNPSDTLHLSFTTFDTAIYRQTGRFVYVNQKFIGIKY